MGFTRNTNNQPTTSYANKSIPGSSNVRHNHLPQQRKPFTSLVNGGLRINGNQSSNIPTNQINSCINSVPNVSSSSSSPREIQVNQQVNQSTNNNHNHPIGQTVTSTKANHQQTSNSANQNVN